jgi:RNA polymerase sigma factor (sigma-70 family)
MVQRLGANDDTLEHLYREHGAALFLFARTITGDASRAQDVVHQVFLRLIEDAKLGKVADAKAYIFTCVRNAALNDAKARQRSVVLEQESAWFHPPERDYAAELNVQRALARLPDEQRQVTVLHIWGGLTFLQIAEVLGISANTAASRYRYALGKLREALCAKENLHANS